MLDTAVQASFSPFQNMLLPYNPKESISNFCNRRLMASSGGITLTTFLSGM